MDAIVPAVLLCFVLFCFVEEAGKTVSDDVCDEVKKWMRN
jgi:hypothetical protein